MLPDDEDEEDDDQSDEDDDEESDEGEPVIVIEDQPLTEGPQEEDQGAEQPNSDVDESITGDAGDEDQDPDVDGEENQETIASVDLVDRESSIPMITPMTPEQ